MTNISRSSKKHVHQLSPEEWRELVLRACRGKPTSLEVDWHHGEEAVDALVRAIEADIQGPTAICPIIADILKDGEFDSDEQTLIRLLRLAAQLPDVAYFDSVYHIAQKGVAALSGNEPRPVLFAALRALAACQPGKRLGPELWVKLLRCQGLESLAPIAWNGLYRSDVRAAIRHLGQLIGAHLRKPEAVDFSWIAESAFADVTFDEQRTDDVLDVLFNEEAKKFAEIIRSSPLLQHLEPLAERLENLTPTAGTDRQMETDSDPLDLPETPTRFALAWA